MKEYCRRRPAQQRETARGRHATGALARGLLCRLHGTRLCMVQCMARGKTCETRHSVRHTTQPPAHGTEYATRHNLRHTAQHTPHGTTSGTRHSVYSMQQDKRRPVIAIISWRCILSNRNNCLNHGGMINR